jgi:general secretion pathway protein I
MSDAVRGFTLLEVLIALAIVAIGLGAALKASGVGTDALGEYRARTQALWLAENVAAEHVARRDWPDIGQSQRQEDYAGARFLVRETVKPTQNPAFRRLEVEVAATEMPERALRQSVTFLTRPR